MHYTRFTLSRALILNTGCSSAAGTGNPRSFWGQPGTRAMFGAGRQPHVLPRCVAVRASPAPSGAPLPLLCRSRRCARQSSSFIQPQRGTNRHRLAKPRPADPLQTLAARTLLGACFQPHYTPLPPLERVWRLCGQPSALLQGGVSH